MFFPSVSDNTWNGNLTHDSSNRFLLMVESSGTEIAHAHNLNIDISNPHRFFPNISAFCFANCGSSCLSEYYRPVDAVIGYMQDGRFDFAFELAHSIIRTYSSSEDARESIRLLPFIQAAFNKDFMELETFLSSLDLPHFSIEIKEAMALNFMFQKDYASAIETYGDLLTINQCDFYNSIYELEQAYCYWKLFEQGKSSGSKSKQTPRSYEDFILLQSEIRERIDAIQYQDESDFTSSSTTWTSHNYPNPFNPITMITFNLPSDSHVQIEIFNIRGQKISTLVNEEFQSGFHQIEWDGTNDLGQAVSSGIYLYRITAGEHTTTQKMLLMK
jgi:hypothetical protein